MYDIVALTTVFVMMFIVHLINGNMIGRHDGMRANSLCMVRLSRLSRLILFLSPHKKYNVWSVLAQSITLLYLCFSVATQMIILVIIPMLHKLYLRSGVSFVGRTSFL